MSYDDREAVVEMDDADIIMDGGDQPDDMDQAFDTLPPGEEGFDISHAGGSTKSLRVLQRNSECTLLFLLFCKFYHSLNI